MKIRSLQLFAAFALVGLLGHRSLAVDKGWTVDVAAAQKDAAKAEKDLFLEFTGSDWCPPCKMLKSRIFDSSHFIAEAPKNFILVKLDYPRDKSHQTAGTIAQNNELSEKYRVSAFPTIVLADAKGRPYAQWSGFRGETPEQYTKMLVEKQKVRTARDAQLAKASEAKGIERAKALDAALNAIPIPATLMTATYDAEIQEIMKLDADKSAGLYVKYESIKIAPQIEEQVQEILGTTDDAAKATAQIDALIKDKNLKGQALQEALFGKALVVYRSEDIPATVALLKKAQALAPNSEKGQKIPDIIKSIQTP